MHEPSNLNDKATKGGDKADKITTVHFEEEGEDFVIEVQSTEFESEDEGPVMTMGGGQDVNSKEVTSSPQQLFGPMNNNVVLLNAGGEQAGCSSGADMKESEQFQFEKFAEFMEQRGLMLVSTKQGNGNKATAVKHTGRR